MSTVVIQYLLSTIYICVPRSKDKTDLGDDIIGFHGKHLSFFKVSVSGGLFSSTTFNAAFRFTFSLTDEDV